MIGESRRSAPLPSASQQREVKSDSDEILDESDQEIDDTKQSKPRWKVKSP